MKLKYKILIHFAYWIYILNQTLFPYYIDPKTSPDWGEIFGYTYASIIGFYGIYFSIPLIRNKKNIWISILLSIILFAMTVLVRHTIEFINAHYIFPLRDQKESEWGFFMAAWIYHDIRLTVIYGIYCILIRLAIEWFETQKIKNELILQTQTSELALLRSQVNPHFLFNTLNNIYSLVYQKSDDAPAAIMKLSSIMRYMLYDATSDKVMLEKEIEYLQSFVELQKLRLREKDFVEITISGKVEGRTIAPMLLIPFVENAFKHGDKSGTCPGIKIGLFIDPLSIRFEVWNQSRPKSLTSKDHNKGIGMNNIKRRLDLLYPGKHILQITQDELSFKVDLILYQP
jgi:LytS/YehU family sensor histidine kinase